MDDVVLHHNTMRDLETTAGNMAEMVYDDDLAKVAQEWANECLWEHGMTQRCVATGRSACPQSS